MFELTNAEIQKLISKEDAEISLIENQIGHKQQRLDRLYEALESGELDTSALAPRISKLKNEIDRFKEKIEKHKYLRMSKSKIQPISKKQLNLYVSDLYKLLAESTIFERQSFLRSFIKRITWDYPQVTVEYTVPLIKKPPFTSEVLSLDKKSGDDYTNFATFYNMKILL